MVNLERSFQAPKGTRDFYPTDLALRRRIEQAWRSASIDFGFDEIEGPTFEHLELYTAKSGDGIVSELFSFRRAGGENDYALRPEFTPTLARMVAAKAGGLPTPVKWFAMPNMFRAERPQRGRLREFGQWNIDLLGLEGAAIDVEVIGVAILALERLGLTARDVQVRVSHRVVISRVLAALGVPAEKASDAMTLLDRRDKLELAEFQRRAEALGLSMLSRARRSRSRNHLMRLRSPSGSTRKRSAHSMNFALQPRAQAFLNGALSMSASCEALRTTQARCSKSTRFQVLNARSLVAAATTDLSNSSVAQRCRRADSAWETSCLRMC